MTGTNGSNFAGNLGDMLRMFLAIEQAKEAIRQFEAGEINVHEAMRRLAMATYGRNAAA